MIEVKKQNDEFIIQIKSDVESKERNLVNAKKQADLRMASIKVNFKLNLKLNQDVKILR